MELAYLLGQLALTAVSVSAAVVSVWHSRHTADRQMRLDLDEMLTHVERLAADQKREKMRRVRAAGQQEEQPPATIAELKAHLRRRAAAVAPNATKVADWTP